MRRFAAEIINERTRSIAKVCDFEDQFSADVASLDHLMSADRVLQRKYINRRSRLREFSYKVSGDRRPRQFCEFFGGAPAAYPEVEYGWIQPARSFPHHS